MTAFDQRAYENEVVRPLRNQVGDLPDDLLARYAVDPASSRDELERRLREVRAYWNNKARSASTVGQVCAAFLRADENLRATHGETAMLDPGWWRRQQSERARARPAAIATLSRELASYYGPLGALTVDQLAGAARAHPDLTPKETERAAPQAGLEVVENRDLPGPGDAGIARDVLRAIGAETAAAGARSVPEVVHPGGGEFRLLDGFAPGRLDEAAVTTRLDALHRGRDGAASGKARHVLGRLRSAARSGVDLEVVALVHLLEEARRARRSGVPPTGLVRVLTQRGLVEAEARRVVVHLLAEDTAAADPLDELRDLLAEGRPVAAGRLLAGLGPADANAGRVLLERHAAQVETLHDAAREAVADGRPDLAEEKLRAAVDLAGDRDDLTEELARLPVAPVPDLDVAGDGVAVRVSWTAAPGHRDDTAYCVVRREDRSPVDHRDGLVVATVVGSCTVRDQEPPVGRPVRYAVFAARTAAGPWSTPTVGSIRVVPPVGDVVVRGEQDAVTARWATHGDVVKVLVRRSRAVPGAVAGDVASGRRSFRDTDVVVGADYRYEIVAVYLGPDEHAELRSEPVVVRGGALAEAAPVTELEVATDHDAVDPGLVVRWRNPPGAEVELRTGRTVPPGTPGALLDDAEVDGWGRAVDGSPQTEGDRAVLRLPVPSGLVHIAAFTRRPVGRVVGAASTFEFVAPPRRLRAQRRGDHVLLSWIWPDDVRVAEVRWSGGRRRLTYSEYKDRGVLLPPTATGVVEVRTLVDSGAGHSVSEPVSVALEARAPSVSYHVRRTGGFLCGPREAVVTVPSGQGPGSVEIVLVVAVSRTRPETVDDGRELGRAVLDLSSPASGELRVRLPKLRRPNWLCCFSATDDVVLRHPHPSELKVS
ncbi:hypothetical protein [Actinomycetospora atypica]|uniref:Fibronectin type-III domain-containing protein n=1 Tax=Actinomycetospora atypica TaxID=1290095 RepID=A0ABV9YQ49_9PSEU